LFDVALWIMGALFSLFRLLCWIKATTDRATQAWRDHKKARRRRRELAQAKASALAGASA
jgi:hypothetical protein